MAYCVELRKLALRMIRQVGVVKTSMFTNISRVTLWRWKTNGIISKKRVYNKPLFQQVAGLLRHFLVDKPCSTARDIVAFLKETFSINVSSKSVYIFIKLIRFSRKKVKLRGQCSGDIKPLIEAFIAKYKNVVNTNSTLVSVDECAFTEKVRQQFGYSSVNSPLIIKTHGSWVHHSLLMAVFSDGRKSFIIKKGSIKRDDFIKFIDALSLGPSTAVLMDNASIHKKLILESNPSIIYTPPYSPEYNPIELCFGKVKGTYRKLNTQISTDVNELVCQSVNSLTDKTIINCFQHVSDNFIFKI